MLHGEKHRSNGRDKRVRPILLANNSNPHFFTSAANGVYFAATIGAGSPTPALCRCYSATDVTVDGHLQPGKAFTFLVANSNAAGCYYAVNNDSQLYYHDGLYTQNIAPTDDTPPLQFEAGAFTNVPVFVGLDPDSNQRWIVTVQDSHYATYAGISIATPVSSILPAGDDTFYLVSAGRLYYKPNNSSTPQDMSLPNIRQLLYLPPIAYACDGQHAYSLIDGQAQSVNAPNGNPTLVSDMAVFNGQLYAISGAGRPPHLYVKVANYPIFVDACDLVCDAIVSIADGYTTGPHLVCSVTDGGVAKLLVFDGLATENVVPEGITDGSAIDHLHEWNGITFFSAQHESLGVEPFSYPRQD